MVLLSNERQKKCEDVAKTTSNTTNTTITCTTEIPTISSSIGSGPSGFMPATDAAINKKNSQYKSETVAEGFISSISNTAPIISASTTGTEHSKTTIVKKSVENDNNEQINEIIKDKNSIEILYKNKLRDDEDNNYSKSGEVEKTFTSAKQLKLEDNLDKTGLNLNNSIKIMAENIKETPLKEEIKEELETEAFLNNHHGVSNKDLEESHMYLSSNNNTLTSASITVKSQLNNQDSNIIMQQQLPLSCPVTPHSLQPALNVTNIANNAHISMAAAGLQPNFLSQLALTANVPGLQKSTTAPATIQQTAKQLNQSFNMLDKSDSNLLEGSILTASVPAVTYDNNGEAKIVLICESNSHPFQTRSISLTPNVECMVGRLIAKSKASENNAIFDCKVLSRKHAVIWYTLDGKFYVKDTKSSNGTFINDNKLGDEEAELHFGDIVKFGVDVLENSRKEVHGCIIACVKLYLPDGREAVSIDSSAHRCQYSGEGRISYDELHRLNLYIQETSQREKVLTSKLCNLQNILDATRKNSALCWSSMISEDQLLHRIHSLEKKLQFMEKNVPDNILRNEILKLLDEKSSYQHTSKEALRKVYQERCDAMQMLAKVESSHTQSENECCLLRDQIMNSKKNLQEINSRLLRLESEYNDYRDEMSRQQQEAKDREELRVTELTEKLRECELECEGLKKKISELIITRDEFLQKEAMETLDAAFEDIYLADHDDSSAEYENDDVHIERNDAKCINNKEGENKEEHQVLDEHREHKFAIITKKANRRPLLASVFGDGFSGVDVKQLQQEDQSKVLKIKIGKSPPKRMKETTIMKWLQNSDLNKNEGSFDIFEAICNANDNEDENMAINETKLFSNFSSKLKNVQKNLKELEAEIESEIKNETCANIEGDIRGKSETLEESSDEDEGASADEEFIIKSNGKTCTSSENKVLSKQNKKYILLKSSVNMLREAYNEICNSVKEQDEIRCHKQNHLHSENDMSPSSKIKTQSETLLINPITLSTRADKQTKLRLSESDNNNLDSEVESLTLSSSLNSEHCEKVISEKTDPVNDHKLLEQLKEYQSQVVELNKKLQQTELEAHHTLEIMEVECDDLKSKMQNLNEIIEVLRSEKMALEETINDNKNKAPIDVQMEKDLELEEDPVLNSISATAFELEEELITYKERLDEQQTRNIDLRNEIASLKLKAVNGAAKDLIFKQYLPCGVIVLAIIIYCVTNYY